MNGNGASWSGMVGNVEGKGTASKVCDRNNRPT